MDHNVTLSHFFFFLWRSTPIEKKRETKVSFRLSRGSGLLSMSPNVTEAQTHTHTHTPTDRRRGKRSADPNNTSAILQKTKKK